MNLVLKPLAFLFSTLFFLQSCSSSDDTVASSTVFSVDNQNFTLIPSNSIVELKMNDINIEGQLFDRSSITITGISGTTVATVSFDLYYKDGLPVEGTYTIDNTLDNDSDFYTNLLAAQKLCLGWTSICTITEAGSLNFALNANNPIGTVKVVNNGNNNYTIQYSNNYREYDNNFQEIGTVPVVVNITNNVVIQ